jgi:hypothetical protein
MLRPIAENLFEERQFAEFQFAEILFAENVKFQKFAEKFVCRKMYLPIFWYQFFSGKQHVQFSNKAKILMTIFPDYLT